MISYSLNAVLEIRVVSSSLVYAPFLRKYLKINFIEFVHTLRSRILYIVFYLLVRSFLFISIIRAAPPEIPLGGDMIYYVTADQADEPRMQLKILK